MPEDRFALGSNIALAQRQRDRRARMVAEGQLDPIQAAQSDYTGGLGWDAFFGALREQEEAANAEGRNYRVSLGSLGMPRSATRQSLGEMEADPLSVFDRQSLARMQLEQAANAASQQARQQDAAQRAELEQRQADLAGTLNRQYDENVLASTLAPQEPGTDLERIERLPPHLRLPLKAPLEGLDLAQRKQAMAEDMAGRVTFSGAPIAAMVNGKRVFVRAGSDGRMYSMDRKPIEAEALTPEAKTASRAPMWAQTPEGTTKLMTEEEIRASGARKPQSAMEAMDERKYKKAAPVLTGIGELSAKINTQQGLLAKMSGGAAKVAAKANYDDDVAEYTALVSGFTPMVARALGHTGVLTQQDVDSVKALFPQPGDSKTLRDRKVTRVLGIIGELEGATNAPPRASGGTVELIAPDGGILDVPASEVEALLKSDPQLKRKGGG